MSSLRWNARCVLRNVLLAGALAIVCAPAQGQQIVTLEKLKENAKKGDAKAQFLLGNMYARGGGVAQDNAEAYKWLTLAAAKGDPKAVKARDALAASMGLKPPAEGQPRPAAAIPQGAPTTPQTDFTASADGWLTDLPKAQAQAKRNNKLVLLDFTGSDWCGWCIKLKKEVFDTKEFQNYAAKNLVLVEVDFPRGKKLSAVQVNANEALQKKYEIEGFPTIIVLNGDGRKVGEFGYMPGGPRAFIAELDKLNPTAATSQGAPTAAKAQAIAAASTTLEQPAGGQQTKAGAKAAAAVSAVQVKLLEAGATPRKVLRFRVKPGAKQYVTMTMRMTMDMGSGDTPGMAMKMPAIKLPMDVTVKGVGDNGDISYEMVMGEPALTAEPDVIPKTMEAMKASMSSMKGLSCAGTMSSRGFNIGMDAKVPSGADPKMRQFLDQMDLSKTTVPLPEEAVGPGAKWEVTMPIKNQGMTIVQIATYELLSVQGDQLKLKMNIAQHAEKQTIENPTSPGLKVELTKMIGNGTGSATIDLGSLVPSAATSDSHSETSMEMNMGKQKQAMNIKMDMNMRLETPFAIRLTGQTALKLSIAIGLLLVALWFVYRYIQ